MNAIKESLPVLGAFVIGIAFGLGGSAPSWLLSHDLPPVLLTLLVFSAGTGIGAGDDLRGLVHGFDMRLLLLPVCTVVGSLLFSAIGAALFTGRSLNDCLAVGSGFGYYSLSSMLIADLKGVTAGPAAATELATVALLANIVREMVAVVFLPVFARIGGRMATISVAGISSMDVCLPMIVRCAGDRQVVPQALFHGIALEISVPFLIGAFC